MLFISLHLPTQIFSSFIMLKIQIAVLLFIGVLPPLFAYDDSITDISYNDDLSIVLTPARLKQAIADVPASVTVISAEMISNFGIRSIPEALRLVPGMAVFQVSGGDYRISYHGTTINTPRRMNVLIDGVSAYRASFALVDWNNLPIAMEDIQRIEVTRSPDSVAYGPNSMLATINIISTHPDEAQGAMISGTGGTRATGNGTARFGGKIGEATSYRVTVDHQQNLGFDSTTLGTSTTSHDASHNNKINFRSITDISQQQSLDVQIALLKGSQQVKRTAGDQAGIVNQITSPDYQETEYDINTIWKNNLTDNHNIQIQFAFSTHDKTQNWSACVPELALLPQLRTLWTANPSYVAQIFAGKIPSGGSNQDNVLAQSALNAIAGLGSDAFKTTCGDTNENFKEKRIDLEFQDTFVANSQLRFVSGVGLRRDLANSQTFSNGSVGNNTGRIFANAEYKPLSNININLGGFFEHDQMTGSSFSPRLGINAHLDSNSTFRFIVSKANRMPGMFEQRAKWAYLLTNLTNPVNGLSQGIFAQTASSPGNLQAEQIISHEIGWNGNYPDIGLVVDTKLFSDNLSNLISGQLQLNDFSPTNNGYVKLQGIETQIDYSPTADWMIRLGYSYLRNDASMAMEKSLYSRNSGSVAISHILKNGWHIGLAMYANQAAPQGLGQSAFSKQDLVIFKNYRWDKRTIITPTFTATHLSDPTATFIYNVGKSSKSSLSNSMQYYFSIKATY